MPESTTTAVGVEALLRQAEQKLVAIAAIADGRLDEAHRLILDLLASPDLPIVSGQCRYCGCTEERPCGVGVAPGVISERYVIVRCSWWDDDQTVCTKVSCIARYEREQGRVLGEHVVESPSRIVVP